MSSYPSSSLPSEGDHIRLLRLLPNENEAAPLRCKLHNYCLQELGTQTHLYEALSYVWGDKDVTLPIYLDRDGFQVTVNLHAALSRLRDRSFERIIWVDAVCINQKNSEEREQQVKLMAKIYSKAHRVIVWLGKEAVDTQGALEDICIAANKESTERLKKEINLQAILNLLHRPWFQRIWVLQEVAAARHVVMICGCIEIDGYAFCLGVKSLELSSTAFPELQIVPSVTYLIERAGLRSKYITNSPEKFSLDISCLAELIDMFHTRKASDGRDKVYALLGMSSDFPDRAGLQPDYKVSWEKLFQKLVKFILGEDVSVETSDCNQRAVIKSKGCILGQVSSVKNDDRQNINITSKNAAWYLGDKWEWTLHASAKSIQEGDIVCLLQGASKPTIIRLCKDYFVVIVIAVTPLNDSGQLELSNSPTPFPRDFLLVWDLEKSPEKLQYQKEHETLTKTTSQLLKHLEIELAGLLEKPTRTWNVALILGDLEEYGKAEVRLREAVKSYEIALGEEHASTLGGKYGLTPLSWAAGNKFDTVVNLLLVKDGADPDLKDSQYGRTPLSWAAEGGHETVVRILLKTGKVEADSRDKSGRTPLSWAAEGGHEAVVKLLLETCRVDVNSKDDKSGWTPLSWAAEGGREAVVKLLLETGRDVEAKIQDGRTALLIAAKFGREAVVKLLLKTDRDVEAKIQDERIALLIAAEFGREIIVRLLLETGRVDVNLKHSDGRTPLRIAIDGRHETVVRLLLQKGADVEAKHSDGKTPLIVAAENGQDVMVQLLLEKGANVEEKTNDGRTALHRAVENGYEAVAQQLLDMGAVVGARDSDGKTPLIVAAVRGHITMARLLLEKGAVVEAKHSDGKTPLIVVSQNRPEAIVRLLVGNGAVVKAKTSNGRTALYMACKDRHETEVRRLIPLRSKS